MAAIVRSSSKTSLRNENKADINVIAIALRHNALDDIQPGNEGAGTATEIGARIAVLVARGACAEGRIDAINDGTFVDNAALNLALHAPGGRIVTC